MNPNPLVPPNFVTLKQLKEKREEEERLKKEEEERVRREEEERLRKLKEEEEEDENERARLRKLEDERNSIKVPSETLVSKSPYRRRGAQWRRSGQRSPNPDARGDAGANLKAREAVNPDARDDANFEARVAANGAVEEWRKEESKKKKKRRNKSQKKGASEEKEGEILKMPLDVNGALTIEKEKEKNLPKMNPDLPYAVYRPVRGVGPDKDPIEDAEMQVSDLKIGGKDPNRNRNWRRRDEGCRRGGRTWVSSGGGGGMMWVKKTRES